MVASSHVLGQYLPWQRSVFTFTEPVYCLFMSKITYLWSARVISSSRPCRATHCTRAGDHRTLTVFLFCTFCLCVLYMLIVSCATPTTLREVSVLLFIQLQRFPPSLSPVSLIYHQWISWNPLTSSPMVLMYIKGKTAIFQSIFSIHWQLSSVWLK